MEWLVNLLTYFSVVLLISLLIASISPKWDYKVKMFYLYLSFILASLIAIPYGIFHIKNPMKIQLFTANNMIPMCMLLNLRFKVIGESYYSFVRKRALVIYQSQSEVAY